MLMRIQYRNLHTNHLPIYQSQTIDPSLLAEKPKHSFGDDNHTFWASVIPIDELKKLRQVDSQGIDCAHPSDDSSCFKGHVGFMREMLWHLLPPTEHRRLLSLRSKGRLYFWPG